MKFVNGFALVLAMLASSMLNAQSSSSDIITNGGEAGTINYLSYQNSSISSTGDGVQVWSIKVRDGGGASDADANPTNVGLLTIEPGPSNTLANWGSAIRKANLFDGDGFEITNGASDVNGNSILIDVDGYLFAPDNGEATAYLVITFENSVNDNSNLQLKITAATTSDFFGTTSLFAQSDAGGATSSSSGAANLFQIVASELRFSGVPSVVKPNESFSGNVQAVDVNGNVDLDATPSVTLSINSGPGELNSATGLTQSLASGSYSWTDLKLDTEDPMISLAASDGVSGLTDGVSSNIEVTSMLVVEDFDEHTVGNPLTDNGWTAFTSGGSVVTFGSALTYAGYASSGVANSAYINPGYSQDVYFPFTSVNSGTIYLAFMVSVNIVGSTGASIVSLALPSPTSTSDMRLVVYARYTSGSGMAFGISKNWNMPRWSAYNYDQGPTYLVVAKYQFNGGTDDDVASLYVNPVLNQIEPGSPTVIADSSGDVADVSSFGAVAILEQGGTDALVDGIRVMTNWSEYALPVQISAFTASSTGLHARLAWSTSTETNNAGFEVERRIVSDVGMRNADYHRVAFIPGAGTSTSSRDYSYTDANLAPGRYAYRIKQVDRDGSATYFREAEVEIGLTAKTFTLNEAFPNPFNPATSIDFSLADAGTVSLKIYDVLGREVAQIFNGAAEAGRLYRATWDASAMPSGMYFARLESGGSSAMKRLMLVK